MHLISKGIGPVVLTAGLIAGCGVSQAPAAQPTATASELVLMQKPDTVEGYVKTQRATYDFCVVSAQMLHLAVKPFPKIPATLGATRTTYLFRGRDTVIQKEDLGELDITKTLPDQGCEVVVSAAAHLNVDMQVGDIHTSITTDPDGHLDVQTESEAELMRAEASMPRESAASYSEPLTLNGIALRCLPETDPAEEACVYGRDDGMVPEPHGRLIVIAARFKPISNLPRMILEPQSLRVIDHPDPKLFSAANYTR
jgi:hypothetical protein